MIGSKLTAYFMAQGHHVAAITRSSLTSQPQVSVIAWDPELNYIEIEKLEGFDVIIHLAGADIAHRWSPEYKKKIIDSRVHSTRLLCDILQKLSSRPKLLICASAVGFYGNHAPQDFLDESSPRGTGFLADVCHQWEEGTKPLLHAGIRVVCMRLGVVLSKYGGALAKMRLPFQLGLGGRLGSGLQMMSWVALDEIPFVVEHLIKNKLISGAVNVVSPKAVTNARFTEILGQVLHRPTLFSVPEGAVRFLFGEMGQDLLLEGAHVMPRRLMESGYRFRIPELIDALEKALE